MKARRAPVTPEKARMGFSAALEVLAGEEPELVEEPELPLLDEPEEPDEPEPDPPAAGVTLATAPLPVKATAVTVV